MKYLWTYGKCLAVVNQGYTSSGTTLDHHILTFTIGKCVNLICYDWFTKSFFMINVVIGLRSDDTKAFDSHKTWSRKYSLAGK